MSQSALCCSASVLRKTSGPGLRFGTWVGRPGLCRRAAKRREADSAPGFITQRAMRPCLGSGGCLRVCIVLHPGMTCHILLCGAVIVQSIIPSAMVCMLFCQSAHCDAGDACGQRIRWVAEWLQNRTGETVRPGGCCREVRFGRGRRRSRRRRRSSSGVTLFAM